MKHLIIGGDSILGKQVAVELQARGIQFDKTSRRIQNEEPGLISFDLNNPSKEFNTSYEAVYFLAGVTSTKFCEENQAEANRLNYSNTLLAMKILHQHSARIIFPSSSHVFSGLTRFVPANFEESPQSHYGLLKRSIERSLINDFTNFSIVRLTKVIPRSFKVLEDWLRLVKLGSKVEVQKDVFISPVSMNTAAQVLVDSSQLPKKSLIQLSGPDEISYEEIYEIFSRKLSLKTKPKVKLVTREGGKLHGSLKLHGLPEDFALNLKSSRELVTDIVNGMDFL